MRDDRPGLRKIRRAPQLQWHDARYVRLAVPLTRLPETDVLSEGSERDEGAGATYYGSTSVLIPDDFEPVSAHPDRDAILASDPHVRLRALRIARTEAAARASGPLGTLFAELSFRRRARGLEIVVDLSAVVRRPARAHR